MTADFDVAVVGGGAAGLATAIFATRAGPGTRVIVLEGARSPGAKILVSGGSRCNVTNTVVTESDFNGGRATIIRRVLRAFPAPAAAAFFRDAGVPLHEEPGGKLFPDSNRSRDVLDALLRELARGGAELRAGARVIDVTRIVDVSRDSQSHAHDVGSGARAHRDAAGSGGAQPAADAGGAAAAGGAADGRSPAGTSGPAQTAADAGPAAAAAGRAGGRAPAAAEASDLFRVATAGGTITARAVVLATGGLSLPKTGSDGWGYGIARRFGHTIVPTTPALAPLVIDDAGEHAIHRVLTGVALPARLDVRVDGAVAARLAGPLLWTHFGASGPAALDASRHWLRARLEGRRADIAASFCPDEQFESLERAWVARARERPRLTVQSALAAMVPASVATAMLARLAVPASLALGELTREARRAVVHGLLAWPIDVRDSRGYSYAEVTAGGVDLSEIDPSTMESRRCPGLYLVGEILDVDGRLGGFNFQWAWSSAYVAGSDLARRFVKHLGST